VIPFENQSREQSRGDLKRNVRLRDGPNNKEHQSFTIGVRASDFKLMQSQDCTFKLESLILAQNERWRRALHMQVERGV
jgi:hypothetical protein